MTIIVRCGDGLIGYFLPKEGLRSRQSRRALFAADHSGYLITLVVSAFMPDPRHRRA